MRYLFILLVLSGIQLHAQIDLNNYTTLASKGQIPKDFTTETYAKVEDDLKNDREQLNKAQEKIFLEGINYAIDEILHSGLVIYGDEISLYVSEIADRLLRNDGALRSKLRFYTIKSNAANAFSTDQGIVFVTTGLVAQLANEAQLAYVLAHEISHYTAKHVVETFDWKSKNFRNSHIERLSQYSKDKEFEADKLGIELYHAAGYSVDGIFSTFDLLMYSYLPFDEIALPYTYFNNDKLFIPRNLFPTKKYPIKAEEDYDDSQSSHPNIKKRKESAEQEIGAFAEWGNAIQYLGNERFNHVRTLARFENVRSDIIDANFGDALYSIFLLELEYPKSLYLKRMKAQIWLNLVLYKEENITNKAIKSTTELEGESASMHFFLKKLNREAMFTLALRQVYDLRQQYPDDDEINAIFKRLVKELSKNEKFKLESYSTKTFEIASGEAAKLKTDTLPVRVDTSEIKVSSKYDRIKKQKNANSPDNFDSSKFYLYALTDIIKDSSFTELYKTFKTEQKEETERRTKYDALSYKEQREIDKLDEENRLRLGINEIIVVEPMVYAYRNFDIDNVKSEKLEKLFSEAIDNSAADAGVTVYTIDSRTLMSKGTQGYNERSILMMFLSQLAAEEDVDVFPVDFQLLNTIKNDYGTTKVMFSLVEHQFIPDINWFLVAGSALIYPTLPFTLTMYIPLKLFTGNSTELNVIILDVEKGKIETGQSYYFNEPIRKFNLGSHMYDIFFHLNSNPQ